MNKIYTIFLAISCCLMETACSPYETDDPSENKGAELTVQTRTGENMEMEYPIQVYAFDKEGLCVHSQEIVSEEEALKMTLPEGLYRIVAIAGNKTGEYKFTDTSSWDKSIALDTPYYALHALMMGSSNIELTDTDAEVSITMSYAVSALQLNLADIPDSATAVKIHVSPVSSSINFKKELANDEQTTTIPCSLQENIWKTETVYVLPAESKQTVFSIDITYPHTTCSYGYTYNKPLEVNQPYVLNGSFKGGFEIDGDFTIDGWKPVCNINFTFGNSDSSTSEPDEPENPGEPEDGTILIDEMPAVNSIWNGCFVWQVNNELADEADLVLMAPEQFLINSSKTAETLADYKFNNWTAWRTFTRAEAEQLRKEYDLVNLPDLNDILDAGGLEGFFYNEDDRYLCENGTYSFNFEPSGKFSTSIGMKRDYFLRPLITIHVKVK